MNRFSFVIFSFILFPSAFCQVDSISSTDKPFFNKETVKVLNLNGRLDFLLSDELAELNNLEELNVSGTNLEVLPKSITKCKKLKKINLSYNPSININQVCNILKSMDITWLSLEGCQLSFIPFQVAEIESLNYLNVSNNLIDELPDNFGKLVNLVELDLAMNQIDSVNFGLNTLPRLKTIDFSYNPKIVIDHLISSRFDFPALEELKLQGVRNFPVTLNLREGRLKKLNLSNTSFQDLNQLTTDSFKVDHVIAKNCEKLDFDFACKTLQKSGVKKLELADEKMENVPVGIRRMKDLEELVIEDSKINYVPSLNNHKNLRRFLVESKELNTIFNSVSRLDDLEYLNIKETGINNAEVEKLVNHFPHAEIVFNRQKQGLPIKFPEYLKDLKYNVPFNSLLKVFEVFSFYGGNRVDVVLESGTVIKINPNSLVTSDGKVFRGAVDLKIKEYKNSLDIYLSGLPMIYDSAALYGFESGGMYQIEATTKEGVKLQLAKDRSLVINTELPDNNTGFQSYVLQNGTWVNNGTTPNYQPILEVIPINVFAVSNSYNSINSKKPQLKHAEFGLEFWKSKDIKSFQLKFLGDEFKKIKYQPVSHDVISRNELVVFSNSKWIIVDKDAEEKVKLLKSNKAFLRKDVFTPFSSDNPKILFQDIQEVKLEPQVEKDNFLLTVITASSTVQFEIIQDFARMGPRSSKRRLQSSWKKYEKVLKKNERHNSKVKQDYEDEMNSFQAVKARQYKDSVFMANDPIGFAKQQKAKQEYKDLKRNLFQDVVNSGEFEITGMGICNIDRIMTDLVANGKEYRFESYNDKGDSIELDHISILSSAYQSAMKYVGDKVMINKSAQALAIAKTKNGNLAFISKSDFMKALSSKKETKKFKFRVVNPKEIARDELAKMIAM
jgi:internalin A